jgi:hypothetical protein
MSGHGPKEEDIMSEETKGYIESTAVCLGAFLNVITPRAVKGRGGKDRGDPKYSGDFEMAAEHPDINRFKAAAAAVAQAKWPGRPLSELAVPWKTGAVIADKAKAKGKNREWSRDAAFILTARSQYQPSLAVLVGSEIIDLNDDVLIKKHSKDFYTGVECLAEFNFVPYDAVDDDGKDGMTCYLQKVLSLRRGKQVAGGGKSASETFKGYVGLNSQESVSGQSSGDW